MRLYASIAPSLANLSILSYAFVANFVKQKQTCVIVILGRVGLVRDKSIAAISFKASSYCNTIVPYFVLLKLFFVKSFTG
jgi:hypothetical protein